MAEIHKAHDCTVCFFSSYREEEVIQHMRNTHGLPAVVEPTFKEQIYELAYGDEAINKGYTDDDVIACITEISNKSLEVEEAYRELWVAVENGTLKEDFFKLREKVRNTLSPLS